MTTIALVLSETSEALAEKQVAAAKKLVDVRNKLAETIQRVDELMGEGGPKACGRDLKMGVGAVIHLFAGGSGDH